ncbi:zinc ABC transporter ATP-binding protein AztA [Tolumonas osonensis]|uniref:Zinc/manganese transport system ATP-binding protein n=1 Tax=Tolumonas osonensis TaxID=675874 RepID=A0A841GC61_9GAMM|nr:zinc ABC transporter ATP-binding protein AztA [Tolumonas osonensis]MBB6056734.1 zinc/manganese transport system ATP-binding protein [Tolumonas osonensis]
MLRFDNLTLGYDRHPAVHHLNLDIPAGQLLAIVGPNGAGKSTLLKGIMGKLKPLQGQLQLNVAREQIAYLPQQSRIDRQFPISVTELVGMGLWRELGSFGRLTKGHRHRIEHALEAVGMQGFAARPIASLSGGQLQRTLFARLYLQNAQLILLDEPFNAIDSRTCQDLLQLLQHWHQQGRTILAVLHDNEQVRHHFPHSLLLARQLVAYGQTADVITPENWQRARHQIESFDEHAPVCHQSEKDIA